MSLDLLRTFQAVYRTGTLTQAAHLLGLTQPAVTHQIRSLEAQVGQPLFVRQARGVRPTPLADDLAHRLDGSLDAVVAVAARLRGDTGLAGRTLQLGGPAELVTSRVLPALAATLAAGVVVRTRLGLADELLTDLAGGRLDLVVSTVRPRRAGLHAEPLCDEEFVLVAAPAVAARLDPQVLGADPARALGALPLLAYAEDLPIIRRWWRHVLGTPVPGRAVLVVPDLRGLLSAATAGLGATVLPRYLCQAELHDGDLVELHRTDDPPLNTLYLAARNAAREQPHVAHAWSVLLASGRSW
jgi:DNA-binding transcriptional LysR family regulator